MKEKKEKREKSPIISMAHRVAIATAFIDSEIPYFLEGSAKIGRTLKSYLVELRKELQELKKLIDAKVKEMREEGGGKRKKGSTCPLGSGA